MPLRTTSVLAPCSVLFAFACGPAAPPAGSPAATVAPSTAPSSSDAATPAPAVSTSGTAADPAARAAQAELTHHRALAIASAANQWMTAHPEGVCPTISLLKADRALDAMADENDAWGRPLQLSCTDSETEVRSAGADGASGTADDPLEKTASPAPVAIVGTPPRTDLPPGAAHPESVGFAPDAARSLIATHAVACANKGRAAGSALATFSLSIAIRPDGTVNTVHANRGKTTERDPSILGCILKNVAKQNFGSTGKDKDITLEL